MLRGVSQLQWRLIRHDPYANAFNDGPIGGSWHVGDVHMLARRLDPWIWERKYELDSLALPVLFAADLEHATGSSEHLDWSVHSGFATSSPCGVASSTTSRAATASCASTR